MKMNYLALDSVPVSSPGESRHAVSMCSQALLIELSSHGRNNSALVYIEKRIQTKAHYVLIIIREQSTYF